MQGSVRYCHKSRDVRCFGQWASAQGRLHQANNQDCIVCHHNSSLHFHSVFPSEIFKAYIFGNITWNAAAPTLWRRLNLKIFILSLEIHACILWNALVLENALALLGQLEKLYIMHLLPLYATGASLTLTNLQVNWICHWCQCYLAVWTLSNEH